MSRGIGRRAPLSAARIVQVGNVAYSRHLWGSTPDIYLDVDPADGIMDDVNKDRRVDYRDARVIYDIIDDMHGEPFYERFRGGLGWYRRTASHGPCVHVDAGGGRARGWDADS